MQPVSTVQGALSKPICGVAGLATWLPSGRQTAAEIAAKTGLPEAVIAEKFGIVCKPTAGADDHPCAMGARAATLALDRAGVRPEEVDVVLSISEEYKEHPLMVSGIKLQQLVGCRNAWAVDVAQRCCTTLAGLALARGLFAADPAIRTILLAGGYRNGDLIDYGDSAVSFMWSLAAGGGALVLRRGDDGRWPLRNALLGVALRSDGDFADDVHVPAGGTVRPLTVGDVGTAAAMLAVTDPAGMRARLAERSGRNFLGVIDDSLAAAGAGRADIGYLALLHMKRSAHHGTLADLGVASERSTYLERYGHVGQFDPILSCELAQAEGRLVDGDLVVMASAGVSYAWGAATLRWGPWAPQAS